MELLTTGHNVLQRLLVSPEVLVNGVALVRRDQLAQLVEEGKVLLGVLREGEGRERGETN